MINNLAEDIAFLLIANHLADIEKRDELIKKLKRIIYALFGVILITILFFLILWLSKSDVFIQGGK